MDINVRDNPVHSRQHGFRSDRSTDSAISEVSNEIESFIFKRQYCLSVFLDIRGAFDNISPDHIYNSLVKFKADADMALWYRAYLSLIHI